MKEILTEWRQFLTEQEDKNKVQSVVKSIFAANGNISLPPEDLRLLQRYVSGSSKTDPLGSAQAATALSVYYKANGNDKFARSYENAAKRLRGLSKYSGNKALTRAVDAFLGADDPVVEKGIYNSKDRPRFAKFIADLAADVKSSTGIRILDPTLSTKPPEWAKKYPISYEALQFTADFLVSDPMSLLSMAIPVGRVSRAIEMKLAQGLRKEVSVGLQKAAQTAAKGQEKATQQTLTRTVQRARTTLEDRAADAAVSGMNKAQKTSYVQGKILEGNIDSGILNYETFANAISKDFPHYTQKQILELWQRIKPVREMSAMEPFEAVEHFRALKGQFEDLITKFNIGVDEAPGAAGYIFKVYKGDREGMRWVYNLAERHNIPIPGTQQINIGASRATQGGKKLFRVLFHELGHTQFLKNYREVAEAFYTEWVSLTERRIAALEKDIARRKATAKTPMAKTKLAQKEEQLKRIKKATARFKEQVKETFDGGGDLGELFSKMDETYHEVMDYLKAARGGDRVIKVPGGVNKWTKLGYKPGQKVTIEARAGKLYFLVQPEEAFAELFEKAARSVAGGGEFTSRNFPKSAAMINKYAKEVLKTGNLIESFKIIAESIRNKIRLF
jgi:hypothetical protein